jgi:hypothetical protein
MSGSHASINRSQSHGRSRAGIARRVSETVRLTLDACGDIGEGKTIESAVIRLNGLQNMYFQLLLHIPCVRSSCFVGFALGVLRVV